MNTNVIESKSIVEVRLKSLPPNNWKAVILCFRDFNSSNIIVDCFKAQKCNYKYLYGAEENLYEAEINNKKIGIMTRCHWGGPQAAILTEEIAHLNIELILGIGACGSLNSKYPKGCQVIINKAINTDGTTPYYTKKKVVEPIFDFSQIELDKLNLKYAKSATVDALYKESFELLNSFKNDGIDIVNMETSPFYATANYYKISSLWIGCVSDCIEGNKWVDWSSTENMTALSSENAIEILKTILH